jgi:lipopolysaccharide/colanic/teichoic acid biosynthesis glycosyltransferase
MLRESWWCGDQPKATRGPVLTYEREPNSSPALSISTLLMNSYSPSNKDDRQTSNQDHDPKLIEYWGNAATTSGNLRIRLRRRIKLGLWRAVVGGSLALKRIIDLLVGGCALALLSPLFLITAILIKLDDRGPIFFKQTRVGLKGCTFCMWKFRSMTVNADSLRDKLSRQNQMPDDLFRLLKMKDDPRMTKIGKWIRKFSIDELPQLVNVIRGEMSLVGPRAAVPREVTEYKLEELQRLNLKPGLTCLWQVGGRSNIDFAGQVRLDVQYIRSESRWLDLILLLKTIPAVLLGTGAC